MATIRMKKGDRIQHILESLLNLVGRKPLESIRTAEIAKESGISEGALFKYFNSKSDIIQQIMIRYEKTTHPLIPAKNIITIDDFKLFIDCYLSSMIEVSSERSAYLRLLLQVSMDGGKMGKNKYLQIKNGFWHIMEDRIKYGQTYWGFNKNFDIPLQVRLFHFAVLMFFIEQEIFNAKAVDNFDLAKMKDVAISNFFKLLSLK